MGRIIKLNFFDFNFLDLSKVLYCFSSQQTPQF